ncbi:MAG: GAF domain-containing protein, partial [Desulfobacterales bacterium]|nr:GAF domain-containing protein [Desulfobacterales bacterium]
MAFKRKLGQTLLFWFLALSLIPMALACVVSYRNAYKCIRHNAEKTLYSATKSKTEYIGFYFSGMLADLKLQSELRANRLLLETLAEARDENGESAGAFVKSETWTRIVEERGADLKTCRAVTGRHDIFLIDRNGDVLFTASGEGDLGANLFSGVHAGSRFALACQKALETGAPAFSDYQRHAPSGGMVLGLVSAAIKNRKGEPIGLIAFQITIDPIDRIMQSNFRLGRTGETYLIGSDLKMRSNSVLARENTALRGRVETDQTRLWKTHLPEYADSPAVTEKAFIYMGPHGKPTLGVHEDVIVGGIPLGVVAEIEKAEAFAPVARLRDAMLALLAGTVLLVAALAFVVSRRIVRPIQELSSGAELAADGRLDQEIEIKAGNEIGELADSFNNMLYHMRTTMEKNEAQNRLKTGQGELNEKMRGELDAGALGANIIGFLAECMDAGVGALYMADEDGVLRMIGSYAWTFRKRLSNKYSPGEGLVGQAALEKKKILISHCPGEYISIQSGLGAARPKNIMIYPLMLEGAVKGVVELGSFDDFSEFHLDFIESVAEGIAISLNSLQSRARMAELLEKTRQQAEELQAREEELQESNKELQEQTRALTESETRLRDQQEELQQVNEELGEQAQLLHDQKADIEKKNRDLEIARTVVEEKARDLEMTSKFKSEFLANMSHELRTPLNSILLLSKLLSDNRDDNLTDEQVEAMGAIYSSGSDLLELINDVLDLSKVESGMMKLVIEEMNFTEFANAMKRNFKPVAREKGLRLTMVMGDDLPETIPTDRQRVEQIIKNFLSNAFKFTMEGSVTLRIDAADRETCLLGDGFDPGAYISFAVIDTGIGVPEDKQKLIFEAFQQVDGSTSRTFGGTGLGLSISRELAGLLGGEIRLQSRPGQGSTFVLYLPGERGDERTPDAPRPPAPRASHPAGEPMAVNGAPPSPGTAAPERAMAVIKDDRRDLGSEDKSVLLIEDDPGFARILKKLAHEHGFKCIIAGNGKTGRQFADYYKPDAIVLDSELPGLNGWTVMTRLKE